MSTTRFQSTIDALKGGAGSIPVETATKNLEGWEEYLSKHPHEGVKTVVQDLGKLKQMLHGTPVDDKAIQTLLHKLSKDTIAVAGNDETETSKHIKQLGEALAVK